MIEKIRLKTRVILALIAVVGLLGTAALAGQRFVFFSKDFKTATYDLDARVPADALHYQGYDRTPYTESYYYQFDGDDGSDFFFHFFYADMGYGVKRYGMDYKLFYPDGKTSFYGIKHDPDECSFASDKYDLQVGPNRVWGDQSTHHVKLAEGPVAVDVTMKATVPLYNVGDGRMCTDASCEKHGMITYFPQFTVTGTVKEGSTVLKVSGWGYGNRVRQNFMLTEMSKFHTALRWQKDGIGFDVHDYQTPPEQGDEWLPILMVHKDGKMIHVSQTYKKENLDYFIEPKSGTKVPTSYRVISEGDGVKVEIEFLEVKLGDYNDPLLSLGPVEKYLLEFLVEAPLDLRFDGRVKLTLTTAEGTIVKQGPGHGLALTSK